MADVGRRADAVVFQLSGVEIEQLHAVGAIPGVHITHANGTNGPGTGYLQSRGASGELVSWKAPGSSSFGPDVNGSAGGNFVLEDGENAGKFVRVTVTASYLQEAPAVAPVLLTEVYNGGFGMDDITAEEAEAGPDEAENLTVYNNSPYTIQNAKIWMDASCTGWLYLWHGPIYGYVQPTSEDHEHVVDLQGAVWGPGVGKPLQILRVMGAGADSSPKKQNILYVGFDSL